MSSSCASSHSKPSNAHVIVCFLAALIVCGQALGHAQSIERHHLADDVPQNAECAECASPAAQALLQTRKQHARRSQPAHSLAALSNAEHEHEHEHESEAVIANAEVHKLLDGEVKRGTQYAHMEKQAKHIEPEGVAVVVPGFGDTERATQVQRNVAWLSMQFKRQNIDFECFLFVYKGEEEFPLTEYNFEPCQIIRHPGFWMSHVLAMPLNITSKGWILHMMDGIEPQADVDVAKMIRLMRANGLGHASPTFEVAPETSYPIMGKQQTPVGRVVDFIEFHFDLFTRPYFACLQDSVDVSNELGWGVDRVLPSLCGGAIGGSVVNAGALGLLDHMTMNKTSTIRSYSFDQAATQMNAFFDLHPEVAQPEYKSLGMLKCPPRQKAKAPKASWYAKSVTSGKDEWFIPGWLEEEETLASAATAAKAKQLQEEEEQQPEPDLESNNSTKAVSHADCGC